MKFLYEPFILRRFAEGRIFNVNGTMPFEFFIDCFTMEQPFFLVSRLDDGRVSIVPNIMFLPLFKETGFWPQNLLPTEIEYVTIKDATYPVIITAHPVNNFELWMTKFATCIQPFVKQTLMQFVASQHEFLPIKWEKEFKKTTLEHQPI